MAEMMIGEIGSRTVQYVRAEKVQLGDLLMEGINAFGTIGRTIYREAGRITRVETVGSERNVNLSWKTPYGESRHERVANYLQVAVVR